MIGLILMAHGTPASTEDLEAFYTEIRRGSPPSPDQLQNLKMRYLAIGGISPLTQRSLAQATGMQQCLEIRYPGEYVVVYGAKHAEPRIDYAVRSLLEQGVNRIIGIVLAPHYSAMSVGEYARRATEATRSAISAGLDVRGAMHDEPPLRIDVVKSWYRSEGFLRLLSERVNDAMVGVPEELREDTLVIFTAHSLPARILESGDPYAEQLHDSARLVAEMSGLENWTVAWQSAGRTSEQWLGPDILELMRSLPNTGTKQIIVCPIGFVADHLEVLYDLDIEARQLATKLGISFSRTSSLNDDPQFCSVLADIAQDAALGNGDLLDTQVCDSQWIDHR